VNPSDRERILAQADAILAYARAVDSSDYSSRADAVLELRELAVDSSSARDELRRLIREGDGGVRVLAAEALARTASFPDEVLPVLIATLDVYRERGLTEASEPWARVALGSIAKYGPESIMAEESVWPYLYAQHDTNLQMYAITAISRMAKASPASWTILCVMCQHANQVIRDFSRDLMNSDSFGEYIRSGA
jgi:hypothetical protein